MTHRLSVRVRGVLAAGLCAALLAGPPLLAPTPVLAQRAAPDGFADLVERLSPAVVNISSTQVVRREGPPQGERPQLPPGSPFEEFFREFFDRQFRGERPGGPQRRATSLGSGFVIDPAGFIVTNNHVIDGAEEVSVTFADDTTVKAEIVGRDKETDLALLKVQPPRPLKAVAWGDSDAARIGDWVLAIGNPFGLGGTVTAGIISARARDIGQGRYDDFIQTDASINRGNSGGPLFNLKGEVIGVNSAIYSPTGGSVGIGFSISSQLARPIIDQLKQYGKPRRGWLGVQIQQVTEEIAESIGLPKASGALVARVIEDSPAAKGRIQQGDVILKFNGREVPDSRRLPRIVADTPVDRAVDVEIWRDRKRTTVKITVGELTEAQLASAPGPTGGAGPSGPAGVEALGLTLRSLNAELRREHDLADDVQGVVVTEVDASSAAAERGIRPGDVIVEVGQDAVASPADITRKIEEARAAGRRSILMLVEQRGERRFVALRLG